MNYATGDRNLSPQDEFLQNHVFKNWSQKFEYHWIFEYLAGAGL